jgi:hypothetical protein
MPEHKTALAPMQNAHKIPKILGPRLDWSSGTQQDMVGPLGNVAHEGEQFVGVASIRAKALPGAGLVRLVEDDQTETQAQQMLLLERIPQHQPGGHDTDAQRTTGDLFPASRRNHPLFRTQPDLGLGIPTGAGDPELVDHLGLPLPAQGSRRQDQYWLARPGLTVGQQTESQSGRAQ